MLQNYPLTNLENYPNKFIFQQDRIISYWLMSVREFLNRNFLARWIGHIEESLHYRPPWSPDLAVCDLLYGGLLRGPCYQQQWMNAGLRNSIRAAVTQGMLAAMWHGFNYLIYISRSFQEGHLEHLWKGLQNMLSSPFSTNKLGISNFISIFNIDTTNRMIPFDTRCIEGSFPLCNSMFSTYSCTDTTFELRLCP